MSCVVKFNTYLDYSYRFSAVWVVVTFSLLGPLMHILCFYIHWVISTGLNTVLKCPIRYGTWPWIMAVSHFGRKIENNSSWSRVEIKESLFILPAKHCHRVFKANLWHAYSGCSKKTLSTRASFTHTHTHVLCFPRVKRSWEFLLIVEFTTPCVRKHISCQSCHSAAPEWEIQQSRLCCTDSRHGNPTHTCYCA